jgi:hypothetical protein
MISEVVLFLLAPCLMAGDDKIEFGKVSDVEWEMTAPADYREADALVLHAGGDLDVTRDNIVIKYHYRIKILTEAGIEKVGEQSFSWNKEYDKIKSFKAHTITSDGKKHKVKKNSIFEKESGDLRVKTFAFPALEPGTIIEFEYRQISNNFRYLKPWFYQTNIYTVKSSVSVTLANGFTYNAYHHNLPPGETEPVITERRDTDYSSGLGAKLKTFTWTRENLPPVTDEPYMSCEQDYRSGTRFQIVLFEDDHNFVKFKNTWQELGELRQKWFEEFWNNEKDIQRLTEKISAGLTDQFAISRAIYEYIVGEYTTVYDYENWFFSRDRIAGLLEDKRGTSEEKNMLLVAMHRAASIETWPVLISTRPHGKVEVRYPDLRQMNYMIVYAQFDNSYNFLHAGDALSPYGILPPNCLSEIGLLVDGKQSELIAIKCLPVTSSRVDRTIMKISPDGLALCSTLCSFGGYYAADYSDRYQQRTPEEFNEDLFIGKLNVDFDLVTLECGRDSTDCFTMSAVYSTEDLVTQLDDNFLVTPPVFTYQSNPFKSDKRFFPVDFTFPFLYTNEVSIQFDGAVGKCILPDNMQVQINGATFLRECTLNDSCAVVKTAFELSRAEFHPRQYDELKDFFDQMTVATTDQVAITLTQEE